MGLFDDIAGAVTGGGEKSGNEGLMNAIGGMLSGGGMQSIVENFTKNGLGDTVSSWIGTGSNLPISAEQIQSVLGSEQVKAIAGKVGISTEDVSSGLASLLPGVIDKLTPDGKVPDSGSIEGALGGLFDMFKK
ncbi:MAG: YidB family protein [Bacteroidia bacterium]|nr:YidB family protein [Bacteroidia bacterium]